MRFLHKKIKSNKGQGLTEYALVVGLVALVVITLLNTLGTKVSEIYSSLVRLIP